MEFTREQLTKIIESAEVVITALDGTNEDLHPDNNKGMVEAWDHLNDVAAPPKVVKELARIAMAATVEPLYQYRIRNGYNGQVTEWQTIRRDQVDFVLKAQPHNAEFQIIAPPAPIPDVSAVARAALDYIDALPDKVVASLPAMPGFDRDWAEEVLSMVAAPAQRTLALANETMDFERLCEIAEEDKGSDVAFESSIMARMLIGVVMNSEPVAYTDAEELRFPHATSDMWPAPLGHGKDVPLYTVQQLNDRERAELTSYRWLVERLEAVLRPDCPAFDAACRALWKREPHRILEKAGYPIDYDSQPPAIKAGLKRQVLTVLRTVEKEVRGEG
jgi:hypothetical protein